MDKNFYMQRALVQAQLAAQEDEVPIGAVVVDPESGEIIAEAHNLSEHSSDATAHAEIVAMKLACEKLKQNRLRGLDLYVSLEPCTMCAAAISFMRIAHLYFAASDEKGGAVLHGVKFFEASTCHHKPIIESGILQEEASLLLKAFFKNKRKSKA